MLSHNTHQCYGKCASNTALLLAVHKGCNTEFEKINKQTLTYIRVKICNKLDIDTYYTVLYITYYAPIIPMQLRYGC